ncbi:MAG TPA: hypothetical protein VLF88_00150 [Candidatus Babeliales bacterium]|nr:hypothetical protein [Candidatus Babeliales bacterium]
MQAIATPSLNDLNGFISKVSTYPVTVKELLTIAKRIGAPKDVISFYQIFDPQIKFKNEEDLSTSSEQVDILRQERNEMPREEERSPEEY